MRNNWGEAMPPTRNVSFYDHISLLSPLGLIMIEWKSWKDDPSYDIMINNEWIGVEYDLESAKECAINYLKQKYKELNEFLN